MNFQLSTKMEINLQNASPAEAASASTFVVKNRIPAIVVSPDLFMMAISEKQMKMGQYKVIVALDFMSNGKKFALDKVRDVPGEILTAEGFDILLTPGTTNKETGNEMKALNDFLKKANTVAEIRWVISRTWNENDINDAAEHAKKNPASFIRTDPNLEGNTSLEDHIADIERIRKGVATKIKISGNVTIEVMEALQGKVARFDVTMAQARAIMAPKPEKELEQQKFEFMKESEDGDS